jgi:tagatose 6-phosphate kinase
VSILAVGLTPTVQRTMRFARLEIGAVNRARTVLVTASGKAVNVARVVRLLGGESRLVQFLGGDTGRFLAGVLEAEEVTHDSVWVENGAPTRTCTTLLAEDGPATELVEEARPVTPGDVAALEATVRAHLPSASALCLSGSFPPGVPEDFYAVLARAAHGENVPVLVDAQRAPLRKALEARPFLVKPNREEAAATLGLALSGDGERDARRAVAALLEAGAAWALVSMGKTGALLGGAETGELWRIEPPEVAAVNPIGSGDSLLAGLAVALEHRASVPEAAALGTACAAANCLTETSGVVRPADVTELLPQVRRTRLP